MTRMSAVHDPEQQEVRRLIALMKDPRYWRDHDPEVLATVRRGFRTLYRQATGDPRPLTKDDLPFSA